MAEVPDHLVPTDGISDYYVFFDGIDRPEGAMTVRFRIERRPPRGQPETVATLSFPVAPGDLNAAKDEGFAQLVLALRQMLHVAAHS